MAKNKKPGETNELLEALQNIENLLVLMLVKDGVTQTEIGKALGVDQSTISKRFQGVKPKAEPKKNTIVK
jgi:DNA-directed RNA polymerase specialized sigma subunit